MRYAQLVIGPAGSGKSTYCSTIVRHCENTRRMVRTINLDPAAEHFNYPVHADIRDLIQVEDVMDDDALHYGPNGGLVFCMEYLQHNLEWLEEELGDVDDDYMLFDCPGQIELYTHIPVMKSIVDFLVQRDFRVCAVFILDSQFLVDTFKYFGGILTALSAMVQLEIPHVNVMTKIDLLCKRDKKQMDRYLEPDVNDLLADVDHTNPFNKKFERLHKAIASLIDDYSLVKFFPMDQTDEESIGDVLQYIDMALQYGEDLDVKDREQEDPDDDGS